MSFKKFTAFFNSQFPIRLGVEYRPLVSEEEIFAFGKIAPIFEDAIQCAGNVVMTVGVREQHEKLIRAVLRNDIAAPQSCMQAFDKFFARVLERSFFAVTCPLEREEHNANRLAVACAGSLEETINISETFKRQNVRAGLFVAFAQNHFNLRERNDRLNIFFGSVLVENVVAVLAVLLDDIKSLVSLLVKFRKVCAGLRNKYATD